MPCVTVLAVVTNYLTEALSSPTIRTTPIMASALQSRSATESKVITVISDIFGLRGFKELRLPESRPKPARKEINSAWRYLETTRGSVQSLFEGLHILRGIEKNAKDKGDRGRLSSEF